MPRRHTPVPVPIGIAVDGNDLFVGSIRSKDPAIYRLTPKPDDQLLRRSNGAGGEEDEAAPPYDVALKITHKKLVHPAGMLLHQGILYVLEQAHRALFTFEAGTGNFLTTLIDDLPDRPEALLFSEGC